MQRIFSRIQGHLIRISTRIAFDFKCLSVLGAKRREKITNLLDFSSSGPEKKSGKEKSGGHKCLPRLRDLKKKKAEKKKAEANPVQPAFFLIYRIEYWCSEPRHAAPRSVWQKHV